MEETEEKMPTSLEEPVMLISSNLKDFRPDPNSVLWFDDDRIECISSISRPPFFRDLSIDIRIQSGPTCVSTVLAMLSGRDPTDFQKPIANVNTQVGIMHLKL